MISWLINNLGTIITAIILVFIVAMILYKGIKNRKSGKRNCSCGCDGCPMNGKCK